MHDFLFVDILFKSNHSTSIVRFLSSAVSYLRGGVIDTVDQKKSDFISLNSKSYLKRFTRGLGAQIESFDEKTRGRKSRNISLY
jgi:hypothetical protein